MARLALARLAARLLAALAFAALVAGGAAAEERILSFSSDVVVEADGSLVVTETIDVMSEGDQIRRGIYRDFPTTYPGPWGLKDKVGFELLEVRRDGRVEPWHQEPIDNGVRIYIGDADVLLNSGRHLYVLVYRTDRQIAFLEGEDELAWNVTGNDWVFPILRARATVTLPDGARPLAMAAYTGYQGETGREASIAEGADGLVVAQSKRALEPYEGLTIAVSWPAGFVARPTQVETTISLLRDNVGLVVGVAGLLATFAYFLVAWSAVGRDPEKGVVMPRFDAPERFSAVATGYVWNGGFGLGMSRSEAFAVALTSLAAKGFITIEEADRDFTVTRLKGPTEDLPRGETAVLKRLFSADGEKVKLGAGFEPAVEQAIRELLAAIQGEYADIYRKSHRGFWAGGLLLAVASALGALALDAGNLDTAGFVVVFVLFAGGFAIAAWVLLRTVLPQIKAVLRGNLRFLPGAIGGLLFAAMFCGPLVFIAFEISSYVSLPLMAVIAALVVVTLTFLHLMEAPTRAGRVVLDHIEGYRLYLSVAESGRLEVSAGEPAMTAALFERHLPYAMALGVADAWAAKFASLAGSETELSTTQPSWYHSDRQGRGPSGLASSLGGSLGGAVASSATAPSRSSGGSSSGGGSSGGGGGGGGGGGW